VNHASLEAVLDEGAGEVEVEVEVGVEVVEAHFDGPPGDVRMVWSHFSAKD